MAKARFRLTFPAALIKEPLIYQLGHRFKVVTSIRRADVRDDQGWVVLELEGDSQEIDRAAAWIQEKGGHVAPVSGDIVEG